MAWNRPSLPDLVTRIETDLISRLQLTSAVLRRSLARIVARVMAMTAHGLHGHVEWGVRQIFASTADAEYLDRHGAELQLPRKVATFATGDVTFTGTNGAGIPAGTQFQRTDGFVYEATAGAAIASGSATVAVRALTAGADGNADEGVKASLVSPIAGVNTAGLVASGGIANGVDTENDANYRARILQRKRNVPLGGALADFERWALEVPGVTRAWPFANYGGLGIVGITFVLDNDETSIIPDSGKISEVQAYIDDPGRRPVTSTAEVYPCTLVALNPHIQIVPDTTETRAAVTASLEDLLLREGAPDSTLLLSHIQTAVSNAPGVVNRNIVTPTADQVYTKTQIPKLGTINWS